MAKFSDVFNDAQASNDKVKADLKQIADDQAAQGAKHGAVLTALHQADPPKRALAQPDGSVSIISLNADGTDYVVENVPGDFDVDVTAPPPPPVPPPG